MCNVPTGFFPGKEALLIIIDEIHRESISRSLDERMRDIQLRRLEDMPDFDNLNEPEPILDEKISIAAAYESH